MPDDVEITYYREREELSEHEALKYLVDDEGVSFLRLLIPSGEQYGKATYFEASITAVPGQPCSIMVRSEKLTADGAQTVAILLITARLIAQAADRQRAEAVRT